MSRLPPPPNRLFAFIGLFCGWALLALVVMQFAVVMARYILGINYLWAQEAALYLHAIIIMLGASWTLWRNQHVRIDAFYSQFNGSRKRRVETVGGLFLLLPMMTAIGWSSIGYVWESWSILEGSREVSGLPGIFLIKSLIPLFALLMLVAAVLKWVRQ